MKPVEIISILGSPRKNGTTARIAQAFTETAERRGASITNYYLNGMQYRGCQGCEGCHTRSDKCILLDDATEVLDNMYTADIVLFSAPVYFGDTCGQFKSFYDRMWSLIKSDYTNNPNEPSRLPSGKTALLILSQADKKTAHQDVVNRYQMYLSMYGFSVKTIVATELDMAPNTDISKYALQAETLAREYII